MTNGRAPSGRRIVTAWRARVIATRRSRRLLSKRGSSPGAKNGDLYLPSIRTTAANSFPLDLCIVIRTQPLVCRSEPSSRSRSNVLRMNESDATVSGLVLWRYSKTFWKRGLLGDARVRLQCAERGDRTQPAHLRRLPFRSRINPTAFECAFASREYPTVSTVRHTVGDTPYNYPLPIPLSPNRMRALVPRRRRRNLVCGHGQNALGPQR